jgi:hypothetical protein
MVIVPVDWDPVCTPVDWQDRIITDSRPCSPSWIGVLSGSLFNMLDPIPRISQALYRRGTFPDYQVLILPFLELVWIFHFEYCRSVLAHMRSRIMVFPYC